MPQNLVKGERALAGQADSKKKLLLILDYLLKYSDENNPVTMSDILNMLDGNNINAERKSVYKDIEILSDYGVDIIKTRKSELGWCYYIGSRKFELVEIQLLIDAVQAASFITANKSKKLIGKIGSLCSEGQMKKLSDRVYIDNRVKGSNEQIYYTIDKLSEAIENKNQIECDYEKCRPTKKLSSSKFTVKHMTLNPYALIWSNDHYYLIANNPKYDNLMHLRVDRIKKAEVIENSVQRHFSEVCEYKDYFDVADYSKKLFNMFSGELIDIKLLCKNELLEQILDRFGDDASARENFDDEDTFFLFTKAALSDGLISWLMQFSDSIKVIEPQILVDEIRNKARTIIEMYN